MRAVVGVVVSVCAGCALVTSLDGLGGGDAAIDVTSGDASDASTDASDEPLAVYTALDAAAAWTTFDMKGLDAGALGFSGGAFDGRYVYFAPNPSGVAARYDTQATFGTSASWQTFALTSVDALAIGFEGAVFDGQYVYFVPNYSGGNSGHFMRFDTKGNFGTSSSWIAFDTGTLSGNFRGFCGGTYDGRYVYFVPHSHGVVARYDTQGAGFTSTTSWTPFDLQQNLSSNARGFAGGVFDGQYVYFVPNYNSSTTGPNDLVARYDTKASFTATASWTLFGTTSVSANATGYFGGAFDGRRIYFAPSPGAVVSTYDTQGVFGAPASWTTLDMGSITQSAKDFRGATFDGKYVYFVPSASTVARYDTEGSSVLTSSWSTRDMTAPDGGAGSYAGAVFDGRYVYFVPAGGVAARFDAKQPASMPKLPAWNGSFY